MATSAAAKYQARWRPVGSEQWSRPRDFPVRAEIEVDGLDRNTEYEFEVRAVSACGASSVWVPQGYTVPDPPALPPPTVPTTKPGPDGIDLDWGDGEDGVRGDLTYEIQRAKILGAYASAAALVSAHPTGTAGDAYFVGSAVYGWDGAGWVDVDEVDNPAWTTVAKIKGTTWTDVVLDTDQYTYRIRSIDYNGNVSGWVVIGQSESATISTVEFADQTNQQIIDLLAADADMAQDIIDANVEIAQLTVDQAVLRAQIGDILEADAWVSTATYPKGDLVQYEGKLYRSLIDDNLNHEPAGVTDAYWESLGNYASLGEAVGATAAQVVVNTATIEQQGDDITAVSQTVAQHAARMPTGTGLLTTEARVTSVESASVTRDNALGVRASTIEARMPTGTDKLANEARVVTAETAAANATSAVSTRLGTVEARMPAGTGSLATQASVNTVDQARVSGDAANAAAIMQVSSQIGDQPGNVVKKSAFEDGSTGSWSGTVSVAAATYGGVTKALKVQSGSYESGNYVQVDPGDIFDVEAGVYRGTPTAGQSTSLGLQFLNGDKSSTISQPVAFTVDGASGPGGWAKRSGQITAPAGAVWARPVIFCSITSGAYYAQIKINKRSAADTQNATATQSLTTSVNSLTGKVNASYTLTLDVNGYVTGFRSENTGSSSTFDIVADKFRVVSPGAGARLEWSDGNQRTYDASGQLRVQIGVWS